MSAAITVEKLDIERARELLRSTRDLDTIREIRDAAKLKAEYHRIHEHGVGAVNDAQRLVVRAQARLGALLIEAKEAGVLTKGGRPAKENQSSTIDTFSLADLDLTRDESSYCQKLAKLEAEGELDVHMDAVAARGKKVTVRSTIGAASTAEDYDGDSWGTPPDIVEAARDVLGTIEIDPASNANAQQIVRANWFYTKEDSGLTKEWIGNVWMNPPYSPELVRLFTAKFIKHVEAGDVPRGLVLVNNATDTAWCRALLDRFVSCFTKRIAFLGPDGKPVPGTRQGQILFYAGEQPEVFAARFREFGSLQRPF